MITEKKYVESQEELKSLCIWREGYFGSKYLTWHYISPHVISTRLFDPIVSYLGTIRIRADGRYNWWRRSKKYNTFWHAEDSQGVTQTLQAAKDKILEGWNQG